MNNPDDKVLKVPMSVHELARKVAAAEDRTMKGIVQRALVEYAQKYTPEVLQQKRRATA